MPIPKQNRRNIIVALLKVNGTSFADIGRQMGKSRKYVHAVADGRFSPVKVQDAIARAVKMPPRELWGEDYAG